MYEITSFPRNTEVTVNIKSIIFVFMCIKIYVFRRNWTVWHLSSKWTRQPNICVTVVYVLKGKRVVQKWIIRMFFF